MTVADFDLHPDLQPLAFLLGTWRGEGVGGYPTLEHDFGYGQEISFTHWGKPVLQYTSHSWALDDGRQLSRESGFWRMAQGHVEVLLAIASGFVEVYIGEVTGTKIEMATDIVARTPTAKDVSAEKRLYGLVGEELMYAADMAAVGQPLQSHLSARLARAG